MNFSTWSIRKPIPSILLFVILTVLGLASFRLLPVENLPDMDFPTVTVSASLPGATPSALETEVTRKVEDKVAGIGGIKHITSTINDGVSVTTVEFALGKNVQEAVNDVRNAVDSIRNTLPSALEDPTISRMSVYQEAVLTYAVSSTTLDEMDLTWHVDREISRQLLTIPGIGAVTRFGGVEREVRVELDQTKLIALNVTAPEVSAQLRKVQQESPGGRLNLGTQEQSIRMIGTVANAAELAALEIPTLDGRRLRLDAVATVKDKAAERRQISLVDGKPTVSFAVKRARGAGEVELAEKVRAKVAEINRANPHVSVREVNNTVYYVQQDYSAAMHALIEGAILAVLVVWLFLRDMRSTFISAVALPLSIIPTFAVIWWLGFALNIFTLLALTMVIGVLVDDAIVEVENIIRHLRNGKTPMEAAMEAANEIGLAVIATSMTLVAVFIPTAFMGGVVGLLFSQFGLTAAIAVLFSLLVARLITPLMAAYMLKAQPHHERDGRLMRGYMKAVRASVAHPGKTIAIAVLVLAGSFGIGGLLSTTFMTPEDIGQVSVAIECPPGSRPEHTVQLAEQARKLIRVLPEVQSVFTQVGDADSSEATSAKLIATLTPAKQRKRSQQDLEKILRESLSRVPGTRISVGDASSGEKLSLVLAGDNEHTLQSTVQRVMTEIRSLPNLGNITSTASMLRPEVIIRPDFNRAAEMGVSAESIGDAIRVATTGDYDQNLPKLNLPNRQIYIRTQFSPAQRGQLDVIKSLRIPGRSGTVPLESVASVTLEGGQAQINRYDRSRNVTILIEQQGRPTGDVLAEINNLPSLKQLPPEVRRIASGDIEMMDETFAGFTMAMVFGIMCVYAVLVLLFHDFLQPMTILAALPLSLGGAFGALFLTGHSLSLGVFIGFIMLMGIVTKNSILLVEYAIMARKELGMDRTAAIIDACHKRARPIIMTTVAMVAGMLPMALGIGGTSGLRAPMAVAVIGGLITSTLLSLLIVPVFYEVMDDFKSWLIRTLRISGLPLARR